MEENKLPREYGLFNLLLCFVAEAFKPEVRDASSANVKSSGLEIDGRFVLLVSEKSAQC